MMWRWESGTECYGRGTPCRITGRGGEEGEAGSKVSSLHDLNIYFIFSFSFTLYTSALFSFWLYKFLVCPGSSLGCGMKRRMSRFFLCYWIIFLGVNFNLMVGYCIMEYSLKVTQAKKHCSACVCIEDIVMCATPLLNSPVIN